MFCPKCASPAAEGQRFCRQCGLKLGLIVDAMDGKRGPADFERVKQDLKELGSSLRAGFEQAQQEIKKSQKNKLHRPDFNWVSDAARKATHVAGDATAAAVSHFQDISETSRKRRFGACDGKTAARAQQEEIEAQVQQNIQAAMVTRKSRQPRSARYHLQQAVLKILTGGAGAAIWYYLLNAAGNSGLLASLERVILRAQPDLTGLVPVIQLLWLLGLIPVAQGIGHLVVAMFLAASSQEQPPTPVAAPVSISPLPAFTAPRTTNEIQPDFAPDYSITEDPTIPLRPREPEPGLH